MTHLFEPKYLSLSPGPMGIDGPPHFVSGPWALKRIQAARIDGRLLVGLQVPLLSAEM